MNLNKAREYFSAYQEGTLDKGLSQSFERALREDAQLQAEYRAFERTMAELSQLSLKEVEPPEDLHEMISARLDRQIWESKQTQRVDARQWWRLGLIGGLAAAVLALAVFLPGRMGGPKNTNGPIEAGFTGIGNSKPELFKSIDNGVAMSYFSPKATTIVIADSAGVEKDRIEMAAGGLMKDKELTNKSENATLFSVKIGDEAPVWISLPGTRRNEVTDGSGTVKQFIQVLADGYGTAVILKISNPDGEINWQAGDDMMSTASKMSDSKLKPELRQANGTTDSLLWIQEH